MARYRMSRSHSRRSFRRTAGFDRRNLVTAAPRGGIRR